MPSIGIQTSNRKIGTFSSGKKVGIYIALNFIIPMDLEIMNKDLIRAAAQFLAIPGYSKMRVDEIKDIMRKRGINKIGFKPNREGKGIQVITK